MRALALGRWHVGAGGLALARATDGEAVAQSALARLDEAIRHFRKQGMDPWELFAFVQAVKAYADLRRFDEVERCTEAVFSGLERFPVFASHAYEVVGQVRTMIGDERAAESFLAAADAAQDSGLLFRRETLMKNSGRAE